VTRTGEQPDPPHVWPVPLARHADPAAAALERAEHGIGQVRRLLAGGAPDPVGCRAVLADLLAAHEHLTALWVLRSEWRRWGGGGVAVMPVLDAVGPVEDPGPG
jgi:hypothetical protein